MSAMAVLAMLSPDAEPRAKPVSAVDVLAMLSDDAPQTTKTMARRVNRRSAEKKRQRRKKETAVSKRLDAQSLHFNNSGRARTFDHQMPIVRPLARGAVPAPPRGRGQYKCSTPEYICKMAFRSPEAALRVVANDYGGGHAHARGCSMVAADLIEQRQSGEAAKRKRSSQRMPYDFYITNNMFDETRLFVAGFGKGTKRQRVLAASGQVTWKAHGEHIRDQRVFKAPTVMRRYTAATCAAALGMPTDPTGLFPAPIPGPAFTRPLAKYYGNLMATDQHSVNVLCSKWVIQNQREAGNNHFHAALFCVQHKTGAVVEAVTKFLGLLSPSFCLSSCLSYGDLADDIENNIRTILDDMLVVSDPADVCYSEAEERDVEFAKEMMEQCYVCSAHQDQGEEEENIDISVERRRKEAKELLDFIPLWGTSRAQHPCPAGCCGATAAADRSVSLDKACTLAKRIISPSITEPAANKYTKVDPVVRKVALMTNFLGIMRRAVAKRLGRRDASGDVDDAEVVDVDAAIGIPRDPMQHHKNMGHVKLNKAFNFLRQPAAKYLPLVWLVVCSSIMVVHYKLFKQGTWYGERQGTRCDIFDFCGPTHLNPVAHALSALGSMMFDPLGSGKAHLALLILKFGGNHLAWPSRVVAALQISLVLAFCILWRKIFHYFDSYPWRLAPAFDDRVPDEQQRETMMTFFGARDCCLDSGICKVLRANDGRDGPNIDEYFDTALGLFLKTLFERVVVTSTQVELQFARLTLWASKKFGLPAIASKAITTEFSNEVKRWRESFGASSHQANNTRPDWTKNINPGSRTNHLHLFQKDVTKDWGVVNAHKDVGSLTSRANDEFAKLLPEKQAEYKRKAKCKRTLANSVATPLDTSLMPEPDRVEGPLGLAARSFFPMRASAVRDHLQNQPFAEVVARWTRNHSSKVEPSPAFPDTIQDVDLNVCSGGFCRHVVFDRDNAKLLDAPARLLEHVRLILRFAKRPECSDPTVLLAFVDAESESRKFFLVGHSQDLDQHEFKAEFLSMLMVHSADESHGVEFELPMLLQFAPGRMVLGKRWPAICGELEAMSQLVAIAERWDISVLSNRVASLDERLVTAAECVPLAAAEARNAEYLAQQASMKAFRTAAGTDRAKASSASRGAASGSSARRAPGAAAVAGAEPGAHAGVAAPAARAPAMPTHESSDSDTESSADEYWRDIMSSLRLKARRKSAATAIKGPLARSSTEVAAVALAPAAVALAPAAAPALDPPAAVALAAPRVVVAGADRAAPVAHGMRLVEQIGSVTISECHVRGGLVAFRITCGRHTNATDPSNTECCKHLPLGAEPLTHAECIRRLKVWCLVGCQDAAWDTDTARATHLAEGGRRLALFASDSDGWRDFTDADLNEALASR